MRKIILSALVLSSVAAAAPAAAQNWGRGQNVAIERQITQLHQRIDNMAQRRLISNREQRSLHNEANGIQNRFYRYARNGLSQREHHELRDRIQDLRQRIQRERHEGRDQRRDRRW